MVDNERTFKRRALKLAHLLGEKGIQNERVLQAFASVPRHQFVDQALRGRAYKDEALPIGLGQTISQPYTVAFQTEHLEVGPGDRVLEIGTGSGYQAAILAELGVTIYSVERHEQLLQRARGVLRLIGCRVVTKVGDGTEGWEAFAPFDGILATAGATRVPDALVKQLRLPDESHRGGRLLIPVGSAEDQTMVRITRTGPDSIREERLGQFRFVPFVGADIASRQ